jgi:hypothetical protein
MKKKSKSSKNFWLPPIQPPGYIEIKHVLSLIYQCGGKVGTIHAFEKFEAERLAICFKYAKRDFYTERVIMEQSPIHPMFDEIVVSEINKGLFEEELKKLIYRYYPAIVYQCELALMILN